MIHNISRFITALALLATAQGAWAEWTGFGYKSNPYIISTPEDLLLLAHRVNGTNGETANDYRGRYFKLGANITFSHAEYEPYAYAENYEAIGGVIGGTERFFKGDFDGDGHTVSGIRIRKTTGSSNYQGLFGYIGSGANIHDVHLTDARITGNYCVGGIVGNTNGGNIMRCSVTDSYITATDDWNYGTICGITVYAGLLTNNYYHGCTVNGTAVTSGMGCHEADITANNGALPAYRLALGDGVTIQTPMAADLGFSCDADNDGTAENYWRSGAVLTLGYTGTATDGYIVSGYTATNGTVGGNANDGYTLTMPDQDVTITTAKTPDPAHFSVNDAGTEYTILTATGWNVFCDLLGESETFSGKTVKLGDNISVTRMAGSGGHEFMGNFNGGGNTLTFTATAADNYCAPFRNVKGGSDEDHAITISNLNVKTTITANDFRHAAGLIALQSGHVNVTGCNADVTISSTVGESNPHDLYPAALVSQAFSDNGGTLTVTGCTASGTISTDGKYAAGLVGIVQGTASISDCISSVTIDSSTSGDGTHGGIVAVLSGVTNIYGTVFNGCLLGEDTESVGGFIGWRNKGAGANIYNSLFIPTEVTVKKANSATFARNKVDTYNSYYTYYLCDGTNYAPYDPADADHPDKYNNGKATRTVAAATDVTIEPVALTGTATQYTVSGITAYSGGGLQLGETLYYGSGDQLSLTLSNSATGAPQGYQYGYTASAGTLSGTTLTMPDQDVTISTALAPIDWATVNEGDSKDPYMIYNKDQLLLLAHRVNGTNDKTANDYGGMYFKLGADITFTHPANEGDDYAENYEAIGGNIGGTDRYFKGNFDGANHTVSGIRIRKTGSGDANSFQGLFGHIDGGANIHDVHLTDARITGYENVGGIAGLNYGTVSGCSVTDSYITATGNWICGTICGDNYGTLRNNYYHGCTVNGTAVTSGEGCLGADITDNNGALPAYRLDLGANITPPPGTFAGQTGWLDTPPVSPRLAPENGFTLAGNHYFASGYVFTPGSTLASGAAQGYTPRATLGGQLLDLYTPTGDDDLLAGKAIAHLTVTADCDGKTLASTQAIYSTGQPVTVAYINADGTPGETSAIALDGTETSLAAGTYFAGLENVNFDHTVTLTGDVTLILADNCHMNVGTSGERINGSGIKRSNSPTLTITSEANGSGNGALSVYTTGNNNAGILATSITINGGHVTADTEGNGCHAFSAFVTDITINGGTVTARTAGTDASAICAYGDINYNGGDVTATATGSGGYGIESASSGITLGWTRPDDRITASSYRASGTVKVADGQALTDGSGHIYTGTLSAADLDALNGKTLRPCLTLANAADNTAAIADHAGQTLAVALSGRTLYKDGSWNTLCLPFSVSTASGTLSGDNVQAMTLDTETSNLADGTLTLNFDDATGQTIPAGMPFIIKWDNTSVNIVNPVFDGVTVSNATNDATVEGVLTFTGTYAPVRIADGGDNTKLYLGAANKLYYPTKAMTIGTHRAYFQLADGITAGEPASLVRAFNLNFGDDEATGIISVHDSGFTLNDSDAWYTLDGRRLDGQPTAKGLYIHGGKKVAIK